MFRAFVYILLAILVITLLRGIIGIVGKALSGMADPQGPPQDSKKEKAGGELKRDPICGTYVPATTSLKVNGGSGVVHFCSPACRDRYVSGRQAGPSDS